MNTPQIRQSVDTYICDKGHECLGKDIPEYGLDIYCPTCLKDFECSPLDLVRYDGMQARYFDHD